MESTTPTFRRGGASYGASDAPAHQPLPQFLMLGPILFCCLIRSIEMEVAKSMDFRR